MKSALVLVSDVVESRRFGPDLLDAVMSTLLDAMQGADARFLAQPEITLGDEIQALPGGIQDSINVILAMDEAMLASGSGTILRHVLVKAPLEGFEPGDRIVGRSGTAIVTARQMMDMAKQEERGAAPPRRIRIDLGNPMSSQVIEDAFHCWSGLLDQWPAKHHRIASALISNRSDAAVAKAFDLTPSAVWKRRKALGIDLFHSCKRLISSLGDGEAMQSVVDLGYSDNVRRRMDFDR